MLRFYDPTKRASNNNNNNNNMNKPKTDNQKRGITLPGAGCRGTPHKNIHGPNSVTRSDLTRHQYPSQRPHILSNKFLRNSALSLLE